MENRKNAPVGYTLSRSNIRTGSMLISLILAASFSGLICGQECAQAITRESTSPAASPLLYEATPGITICNEDFSSGSTDVFKVDFSLSYSFAGHWSTYHDMGQLIRDNALTPPAWLWDMVPSGTYLYWRVRAVDLNHTPLSIGDSSNINWLYKP